MVLESQECPKEISHISVLGAVAARPDCDVHDIIHDTGISSSKVNRILRALTKADIIVATQTRTGTGYQNITYRTKYDKVFFNADKDKMIFNQGICKKN